MCVYFVFCIDKLYTIAIKKKKKHKHIPNKRLLILKLPCLTVRVKKNNKMSP